MDNSDNNTMRKISDQSDTEKLIDVSSFYLDPEIETGNHEYKYQLVGLSDEEIESRVTQLNFRLEEGNGEAIYEIGVTDDGCPLGLTKYKLDESIQTLEKMAEQIDATVQTIDVNESPVSLTNENNRQIYAQCNHFTVNGLSKENIQTPRYICQVIIRRNNYENNYVGLRIAVAGAVDAGKCLAKETPVLMYDGSIKNIENIVQGDLLMGDDSTPRTVIKTTQGFGQLYKINPMNGDCFTVNKNHILCFKISHPEFVCWDKSRNKYKVTWTEIDVKGLPRFVQKRIACDTKHEAEQYLRNVPNKVGHHTIIEIPFYEYINLPSAMRIALKLYRTKIEFPSQMTPLDPYILGYWLGDGISAGSEITTNDKEIISYFENKVKDFDCHIQLYDQYHYGITGNDECHGYRSNHFRNVLIDYKLIRNKHIPSIYLYNSRDIRLKLLAGLIDSDGYYGHGGFYFTMSIKYEKLIDDIIYLIRSLGFASYKSFVIKTCTNGANGPVACECASFAVNGIGIEEIPCILNRKKATPRKSVKNVLVTGIDDIDILPDHEYYGFELDGNSRFLLGDFTVTHNSSTIGVLTQGVNDDGNGKARQSVFNFKHEIDTGRTTSVAQEIIGFDSKGEVVNEKFKKLKVPTWPDIVKISSKICTFYDMAGHEKYFNTTMRGMSGVYPDYCLIMIGSNMGLSVMTREHMIICLMRGIPMIVLFTKIDIAPEHITKQNITKLCQLLKGHGVNKTPYLIKNKRDIINCCHNISSGVIVPIIKISNVTGENLDLLKTLLNCLPPRNNYHDQLNKPAKFTIQETFQVPGIGTVVSGFLLSGVVSVKNTLWLGPDCSGLFKKVTIKSIHDKRTDVNNAFAGQNICFALRGIARNQIRKGMVLIDGKEPEPTGILEFDAEIEILGRHSTSIRIGYEPVIHISNIKQTARIVQINDIVRKIPPKKKNPNDKQEFEQPNSNTDLNDNEHPILRAGDKAKVRFQFRFHPVYFEVGNKALFREGRTRGVGVVEKIIDLTDTKKRLQEKSSGVKTHVSKPGKRPRLSASQRRRQKLLLGAQMSIATTKITEKQL